MWNWPEQKQEVQQEAPKVSSLERDANKLSSEWKDEVWAAFDKQQELQEKATYEKNKVDLIKNIIWWNLNQEYNRTSPNNTEYRNKLFLEENTLQVKAYVAYYNTQITNHNALDNTDFPIINVDNFIKNYEAEKPKAIDDWGKRDKPWEKLDPKRSNQEVGEFVDLTPDQQQKIIEWIWKVVSAWQKINKLTLRGYADATQVTEMWAAKVQQKFLALRQTLIDKWITASKLPSADYFKGVENMEETQKQKVLNEWRASARAMMQIAFLPTEYIQYINENTVNLTTDIDAKPVWWSEKWDQYTWWMIEMQATWNEWIRRELTEVKNSLLKMIDIRQINYVYTHSDGSHYWVGGINLASSDGKLSVNNVSKEKDRSLWSMEQNAYLKINNQDQSTFFHENSRINTLRITINDPHKKDENWKELSAVKLTDLDNRITDGWMNLIDANNGFDSFINSLNEFKDKSKWDKNKESYAANMITILQTYKDVDQQLTQSKEIQNIIL